MPKFEPQFYVDKNGDLVDLKRIAFDKALHVNNWGEEGADVDKIIDDALKIEAYLKGELGGPNDL